MPAPRRPARVRRRHRPGGRHQIRRRRARPALRRDRRHRARAPPAVHASSAARSRTRWWPCSRLAASGTSGTFSSPAIRSIRWPRLGFRSRRCTAAPRCGPGSTTCPCAISARSARCCSAAGVGFIGAAAIAIARQWRSVEAALALALLATFWFVIPYQESRFLFAAFGAAAIAIARAADRPPAVVGWCGLAVAIGGSLLQWPTRERLLVPVVGAAAALVCALWRRLASEFRIGARRATGDASPSGSSRCSSDWLRARSVTGRRVPPYTVGDDDLAAAWAWFRANVARRPRRLHRQQPRLPARGPAPREPRRLRQRRGRAGRSPARLRPARRRNRRAGALSPRRRTPRPGSPTCARRAHTSCSSRRCIRSCAAPSRADRDGFPVERAWADARPDVFHLRYASAAARVYAVELP